MEKDIEDLDTYLFKVTLNKDAEDCYDINITKRQHVVAVPPVVQPEPETSSLESMASSISIDDTDSLDEWGDVADALANFGGK